MEAATISTTSESMPLSGSGRGPGSGRSSGSGRVPTLIGRTGATPGLVATRQLHADGEPDAGRQPVDSGDSGESDRRTTTGVSSIALARAVRTVGAAVREAGLVVPVFRSPPRAPDLDRSVRRNLDGTVVVAVRLTGRPFVAVEADIIEGVIVANGLSGVVAARWRRLLWNELHAATKSAAA